MKKIFLPLIISLIFTLLLTGCSKPENYGECYNTEKMSNFEKINKISNISFQLENSLLENLKTREEMIDIIKAANIDENSYSPSTIFGNNTFLWVDKDQYAIVNYNKCIIAVGPANIDFNIEATELNTCIDKLGETAFLGDFNIDGDINKVTYKKNTKIIAPVSHKDAEASNNMKGYLSIIQNNKHAYFMVVLYTPDYYDEAKILYTAKSFEFKGTKQPENDGEDLMRFEISYE